MHKGEKRPSWFKLFLHQKPIIDSAPDDVVGKAVKAAFHYFATKEEMELDVMTMVVYSSFKPYIEESFTDYERLSTAGKKGMRNRWGENGITPLSSVITGYNEAEAEADADAEKEAGNKADKPTHTRFAPPTIGQVTEYCTSKGYSVDPERFVDYYTSNGWMVGKNKMKDWKAAVRSWNGKEKHNGKIEFKPLWSVGTEV